MVKEEVVYLENFKEEDFGKIDEQILSYSEETGLKKKYLYFNEQDESYTNFCKVWDMEPTEIKLAFIHTISGKMPILNVFDKLLAEYKSL